MLFKLSNDAEVKFLDGMILDYLLEQVVRQERPHLNETAAANFAIDGQ